MADSGFQSRSSGGYHPPAKSVDGAHPTSSTRLASLKRRGLTHGEEAQHHEEGDARPDDARRRPEAATAPPDPGRVAGPAARRGLPEPSGPPRGPPRRGRRPGPRRAADPRGVAPSPRADRAGAEDDRR